MKHKSIFAIAIIMILTCANTFAQTEKGNFILGGNTSFSISQNNTETLGTKTKLTNIILQPYAGYFLFDKFSVGLNTDLDYNSTVKNTTVSVLSDFRYYFGNSNIKPFVKLNAGYANQNLEVRGNNYYSFVSNANGLKLGGGAGIAIFIKDNMSIDITGQYFYSNLKRKIDSPDVPNIKAKVDELRLFIGFSLYL